MTMHRKVTRGVKLAVRQRLITILEDEIRSYNHWKDHVAGKMKTTRRIQVQRAFKKRLQAMRIVIYILTPREMRDGDMPTLFERD